MKNSLLILITTFSSSFFIYNSNALSTDKDQPASIEADTVTYDFKTGKRSYRGNVTLIQGTLRVEAEDLTAEFDGDSLLRAIANGNDSTLAKFKQRPDGKDEDIVGIGKKLVYDEVNQKMKIIGSATLTQGTQTANGERIIYDIAKDSMLISKGNESSNQAKVEQAGADSSTKINSANGRSKFSIESKNRPGGISKPISTEPAVESAVNSILANENTDESSINTIIAHLKNDISLQVKENQEDLTNNSNLLNTFQSNYLNQTQIDSRRSKMKLEKFINYDVSPKQAENIASAIKSTYETSGFGYQMSMEELRSTTLSMILNDIDISDDEVKDSYNEEKKLFEEQQKALQLLNGGADLSQAGNIAN